MKESLFEVPLQGSYSNCHINVVDVGILGVNKEEEVQGKWSLSRGKIANSAKFQYITQTDLMFDFISQWCVSWRWLVLCKIYYSRNWMLWEFSFLYLFQ